MSTTLSRQNTLFVSEDWLRIYEAIQNVDFRAYDFDNYVQALFSYLRVNYPEEFNDWIQSSEFIMKVDILAWLSQNISFRIDLNTRENFLATAERRDSLIRLAQNVAYKVNRVRSASGQVKIDKIRTNQQLVDSNNIQLQDRDIIWNDPRNEDWFEQFILVMNAALSNRTQFGRPLRKYVDGVQTIEQYVLNSNSPTSGSYSYSTSVNGIETPFDIFNASLNTDDGTFGEIPPNPRNTFNVFYETDGRGLSSVGTGFFFQTVQGILSSQEEEIIEPIIVRTVDVDVQNINNDDFFVQKIDNTGAVLENWTLVDNVFGEGVAFNTEEGIITNIYELDTLTNDRVRVRFGDGAFGAIPQGKFRFWYRTANPQPQLVKPEAIQNQQITIPYIFEQTIYFLTVTFSLKEEMVNAASSETNFDIRTRANRVFYSQNRMITGQDYNSFFLRDNAIVKVKSVNRTYTGHSRYTRLTDPTGLYDNLKVIAEDGRYYVEDTTAVQFESADENILPVSELINNTLKPILRKQDKSLLYYTSYPQVDLTCTVGCPTGANACNSVVLNQPILWSEFEVVAGQSRGNVQDNTTASRAVGYSNTTDGLQWLDVDAVATFDDSGTSYLAYVDRIIDDGTPTPGVILRDEVPDGAQLLSVFPAFRTELLGNEVFDIETVIALKADFGLRWDQCIDANNALGGWRIVTFDNLDKTSSFSLDNQGDTSAMGLDASWLVLFEFIPGGTDEDQWKITDRGVGQFFESASEVDFYFAGVEPVVDQDTGQVMTDNIALLECNETRDSERRLGISNDPTFIDDKIPLYVADALRHDDGYINANGLFVTPADEDRSGFFDNPFLFTDLVITDGETDLVLWRRVEEQGFDVWEPIGSTTSPKGTYGDVGLVDDPDPVTNNTVVVGGPIPDAVDGDIHYEVTPDKWFVADITTNAYLPDGRWIPAPDQTDYKRAIGRNDLSFIWSHFSADKFRIDPSISNVMDVYLLTATYDTAYRTWLRNNGDAIDEPDSPTPESLRIQFANFEDFKAMSDAIIYHTARYLPLFGRQAIDELQATFKVIQTPGSQLSENDIKLGTLNAINNFFAVDNWDFGDTFYFTELAAFIHASMAPDIQSVVIVPKNDDQAFGRLFQVRSEPDQLFVSAASPEDIELVDSLTDEELRVGTVS